MTGNVLIVDDTSLNRKIIKSVLSKTLDGINYLEAKDGFEALAIIANENVNVVVLDIMMPGMDGIEVLKKIKENPSTKNLPVIMCSALNEIENIEKALSLGALDYFTKPLTEEQIRITLPLKIKNAIEYYNNKNELVKFYEHIKDEMLLAEQVQKALISEHKDFALGKIWGRYMPCEKIGGDIFCSKQVGNKLWFIIADVSGHGISAAMVSTMLNVIFNTSVEVCGTPDELLAKINSTLFEVFGGSKYGLISAFAGCISENSLCYSNAGHPYPILYESNPDKIQPLMTNGFLLGMFDNIHYEAITIDMKQDDAILLYTDGLFDKGNNQGFARWDNVINYCDSHRVRLSSDENGFLDEMIMHFESIGMKKFIDDVAVMLIKKK